MKSLFLSIVAILFTLNANAEIKTESFFRVKLGKGAAETVLLTDSLLDGEKAYFASYSVDGRLIKKAVIDKATHDSLVAAFDKAISEPRQKEIETALISCGQPLEIKKRKGTSGTPAERRICLDNATIKEQRAIGQWWRSVRTLLRL